MLTDAELQALFVQHAVPEAGRERIRRIRVNPQHRVAKSNRMSGRNRYAPIKMPFAIDAEAHSTEYVTAVEMDHDSETLEFYAQVEPLKIKYLTANKTRHVSTLTTSDFLRISKQGFTFIECKREEELVKLAKVSPNRYQQDESGQWRSHPCEAAAAALGCSFEIRSSRQNNWTLHENLELLKDYFTGELPPVARHVELQILSVLQKVSWISTYELIHGEHAVSADALYSLIAQRKVYFPLLEHRLTDQDRCLVFRDELTFRAHETFLSIPRSTKEAERLGVALEVGSLFDWDGASWKVINVGRSMLSIQRTGETTSGGTLAELSLEQFTCLIREGRVMSCNAGAKPSATEAEEILRRASPERLQEAQRRYEILQGILSAEDNPLQSRKKRARQYWQADYRAAEVRYGFGFVGLLAERGGNRRPRASTQTLELADQIIAADWETVRRKGRSTSHGKYVTAANAAGLDPISYQSFCKRVHARSGHLQAVKQIGEKAAYDLEPQYLELEWTTPRHGIRPWHIAHIDHTPLPLKLVHSKLGNLVETVWLTILLDAYSRKVIAYYLSFDPPSHRSCMMVLRDCVRRHSRVPQIIVCDQGSDFGSTYFETQLAMLRITKRERRAGKPRDGSVCERIFRTSQSQFVSNLLGSTEVVEKYFRRISPEVDPIRHAIWTFDRFDEGFQRYLDEVYHVNHHSGIGRPPNDAWAEGMRSHGERTHRLVPYDKTFIAQSCPAVQRGTAKVSPAGIKVRYRWFKCFAFSLPGVNGTHVHARYDPFNAGLAYAFVQGQWHECHSEFYAEFSQLSDRLVRRATEAIKLSDQRAGSAFVVNSQRLAAFLQGREAEESLAEQHRADEEARGHRERINHTGMTAAVALPPSSTTGPTEAPSPILLEDI